jgi:hypothetical protein
VGKTFYNTKVYRACMDKNIIMLLNSLKKYLLDYKNYMKGLEVDILLQISQLETIK